MAVYGQITGNLGTTPINYGSALAVQTINTGFGDSAGNNDSAGGSELDAAYGKISGGNLYLFLAGNAENNGNHWNIFVQTASGGQSSLNITGGWDPPNNMNGSTFSPGFAPTLFIDANDYQGTFYMNEYGLSGSGSANYYDGNIVGSPLGIYSATTLGGPGPITVALNNNNASSMNSGSGNAFSGPYATTGLELQIPLASYGYAGGPVMVMAAINGGGDGYLSNQFLPGLPVGTQNLATSGFSFGSTPGEYFTVIPEPSSIALVLVGLLGAIGLIRRRS